MPQQIKIMTHLPRIEDVRLTEALLEQTDLNKLLAANPAKLLLENLYPTHSVSEIASMMRISRNTVRNYLKKFGIKPQ